MSRKAIRVGVERTRKDAGVVRSGESDDGGGGEDGLNGGWAEAMAQKGQSGSAESLIFVVLWTKLR